MKNSFKEYCTNTAKIENVSALTFEPKKFTLAEIQFKPVIGTYDESIHKEGDVAQPFFAILSGGVIAGAVLSAIGATGIGLIVIAAVAITAYITAFFINSYKQDEERKKYEEFKRKVERKFQEAKEWYNNNSIIYKPNEISELAYNICSSENPLQLLVNTSNDKSILIKEILNTLEKDVNQYLDQMKNFNGNIEYSKKESGYLLDIFSLNSGIIPFGYLNEYNDKITKIYSEITKKIDILDKNTYQIKNNLAKKFAKKDMEEIQNKLDSDSKLIDLQNIVFSELRDKKVKQLFKIFIENREDCEKFTILTDSIMQEIEEIKNNTLKNNVDQYNKNNNFITDKLPKMMEVTKNYTNFRKKLVCGEQ